MNNKITTYLLYAIGEIFLVVIGILIAVQIDDWNKRREEQKQQRKYYEDILVDLRKDSAHFANRISIFKSILFTFYDLHDASIGIYDKEAPPIYDQMVYNVQFLPLTQQNQQGVIDQLKDYKIRGVLNEYFQQQMGAIIAFDEYNATVVETVRPLLLNSVALEFETVFHENKLGFLPKDPLLNPQKMEKLIREKEMKGILSSLRISAGYVLFQLNSLMQANNQLINSLGEKTMP